MQVLKKLSLAVSCSESTNLGLYQVVTLPTWNPQVYLQSTHFKQQQFSKSNEAVASYIRQVGNFVHDCRKKHAHVATTALKKPHGEKGVNF